VTGTIASPSAASTTIAGLSTAGTYTFNLVVTDSNNLTDNATVNIIVNAAASGGGGGGGGGGGTTNTPPTANAGSAQTITLPTSSVTLSGTGTPVSPATISSYAWTQTAGPVTATTVSPTAASTNITGLSTVGTYTFKLVVTDSNALTGNATVNVTVNAAPIGTPIYVHTITLRLGMNNSQVKNLQKALNALGFVISTHGLGSPGNESTYFGTQTRAAVIKFQKYKHYKADGVVGSQTGQAIQQMSTGL
jgi:hypothetical protein